jgi:predicted lipoprotein with Yx(FWY)xxD motif
MNRLPIRVGGLSAALVLGLVAAGCGGAIPSKQGAAGVKLTKSSLGSFLVDAQGHTLYLFEKDEKSDSYCMGACAAVWPPLEADHAPQALAGVPSSALGVFKRDDGEMQVTYMGHPLYYYAADASTPGKTKGEGVKQFGAEWYVVGRNGKTVEPGDNSSKSNSGGGGY